MGKLKKIIGVQKPKQKCANFKMLKKKRAEMSEAGKKVDAEERSDARKKHSQWQNKTQT